MAGAGPLPLTLRLDRLAWPVRSLGPGLRVGLWVQGCSLGCPGCVSPSLWPPGGGRAVAVEVLARAIAATEGCDGLTLSGGEPFEQYGAVMALCAGVRALRQQAGAPPIEIGVYSGYTLGELEARHPDGVFRRLVDWLIDGRYRREEPADDGVRGSLNQRRYRFMDGVAIEASVAPADRRLDLCVPDGDAAVLALVPRAGELERLGEELRSVGLPMRFR